MLTIRAQRARGDGLACSRLAVALLTGGMTALAACAAVEPQAAETLAFPGAEGAGRFAKGGRGGAVYKVTTLADSGPGSLRAAVEAAGPRTVVFEISGTIQLGAPLIIRNPNITIAGQTAPGDGVTLRDYPLIVSADDVIVRYLRVRLGDVSQSQDDALWVRQGRRIILDHVSTSWSVDETLSVSGRYEASGGGPYDVTVQWSIIGESLNRSAHDKGQHGFGSLVRGGRGSQFTFHHNLWASHLARMPRPGNYTNRFEDEQGAFFDFRNNVFYNWGGDASGYNADKDSLSHYNFVGNAYVTGPNSKGAMAFKEQNPHARAYFSGNAMNGDVPADPWSLVLGYEDTTRRLSSPFPMPGVVTGSPQAAYDRVLAQAGASRARDAVDARIVAGVASRSHRMIDSQSDVGGWPALASLPAPPDRDGDGMPDDWERVRGLDPHDPSDGPKAASAGGYTHLEFYLNSLTPRS